MLELSTARSGRRIARINGTHLHSSYDPEKEAERFVKESMKRGDPSTVLLLGAGLGYLYGEISRRFPSARVIVVFYHEEISRCFSPELTRGRYWHPEAGVPLLQFLRSRIHELEMEGLVVLEWPASAGAFPALSLQANRAVHQLLRETRGSLVTTAAMGRRWLRNSLMNFLGIEAIYPSAGSGHDQAPIVIAASGPTLQEGIDFLASCRDSIELWALPSSLDFLLSRDILPDTVILTDPSYYAFTHLQCARNLGLHLTMPLSAAEGAWRISARVTLVSQDTPVERALLRRAALKAPHVPSQGTVAATALLLALQRKKTPVVFAGLDLCYRDIVSHVRPNNFELWLARTANRLDTLHHRLFSMAVQRAPAGPGGTRRGLALDTYAGWFREIAGRDRSRIFRFHPSETELPDIADIGESDLDRLVRSTGKHAGAAAGREAPSPLASYPPRERRRQIVTSVLDGWIRRVERLIPAIGGKATLEPLMADGETMSLLYLCNAAQVAETRRVQRLQGLKAAIARTGELLEDHRSFLISLRSKLSGNG
jgi:hypothetical protein